jgi:aspartyl-tRNA(Asn)/glutamyl-tRNA(Gln) amidotransferase subunit A
VGPLARTVTDAAILLAAIAGYDAADPFCADAAVDEYPKGLKAGIKGWRIALGRGDYVDGADGQVVAAVENGAQALEAAGAKVVPLDVSFLKDAALANGMMTQADGAAFHRERLAQDPEWFGDDVRRRLEAGRDLPVSDYILARKTQSEMKRRLTQILDEFDVLALPTTPITAPRIEGEDAVEQAKRLTRFTAPFNLTGLPALSVPCGLSREGLPVGMQMVCGAWLEARLLQAGAAYERASGVRDLCPPI